VCRDYTTIRSDTTNIDQSVAEWLKNVVEGAEATGHPLEHVFFEEGEHCNMHMQQALLCCWAMLTLAWAAMRHVLKSTWFCHTYVLR
jgi:hypothetical protein